MLPCICVQSWGMLNQEIMSQIKIELNMWNILAIPPGPPFTNMV